MENWYDEDEIIFMMSCWVNRHKGFGRKNCEENYREERENDKDNVLFEEAMFF